MRNKNFIKPYTLASKAFCVLHYDKQSTQFFFENASCILEHMRDECWRQYLKEEAHFFKNMLKSLYTPVYDETLSNQEAVHAFIDDHAQDFYTLALSNTQSRRSRAGTEFEAIIEMILMGTNILFDSQGFLSSGIFHEHNLGKAVDLMIPGVVEYGILKRNCALISCKTSLRERWAEVIEEKDRTGASEIFLATLDAKISSSTLKIFNDKNVIPVVTKAIKADAYQADRNVITYEDMLSIIQSKNEQWTYKAYAPEQCMERVDLLKRQMERHIALNHIFSKTYYQDRMLPFLNIPDTIY